MASTSLSSAPSLNFITFNQDHSCLAVGTSQGFRIYHTDPFSRIFSSDSGNIAIIEMLFSTSLVALILSPRHLLIQNTKRASVICELTFPHAVRAVRLNRKRLAVVLDDEIYLYDISNMSLLTSIATSPNPNAIAALSPSSENCYLAYPLPKPRDQQNSSSSSSNNQDRSARTPSHAPPSSLYAPTTSGDVLIYDTLTLKAVNVIEAHRSPLSCIAINSEGTLLATASETGTIIRVFSVPHGKKLFQFRRGTYPSTIYSMSFNQASSLLCVSSTTDTVHIFRLQQPGNGPASPTTAGAMGGMGAQEPTSPRLDRWSRSRSHDSNDSPSSRNTGSPRSDAPESSSISVSASVSGGATGANTNPNASTNVRRQSGSFSSILRRSSQLMGRSVAGVVGSYLPQTVTEMWEPLRDFAYIKIPKAGQQQQQQQQQQQGQGYGANNHHNTGNGNSGSKTGRVQGSSGQIYGGSVAAGQPIRSVVAMSSSSPQVMVVTSDGGFYVFNIDMEHGGEGYLVKQFSVLEGEDKLDV